MFQEPIRCSQRLNQITHAPHEQLDKAVKANAPFDSLASYTRFLSAQYLFQQELKALYTDPQLIELFADQPFSEAQEREIDTGAIAAFERFNVLQSHAYTPAPEAEPA
jgi:heme oxygenase